MSTTTAAQVVHRDEQPYAAIRRSITMDTFGEIADRLPEVEHWLSSRDLLSTGPPFFRYLVIDMDRQLDMEAGFPVAAWVEAEGDVLAGSLPAGRYATVTHTGHPDELVEVTGRLLEWAAQQGLTWDAADTPDGQAWGCRLEVLHTDPAEEPDMSRWQTQLLFRLADA